MSSRETESLGVTRYVAEHRGTLHNFVTVFTEIAQSRMHVGQRGSVDDKHLLGAAFEVGGNGLDRLVKRYLNPFVLQCACKVGGSAVITRNPAPFGKEVTLKGGHAYTSGTCKVYLFM